MRLTSILIAFGMVILLRAEPLDFSRDVRPLLSRHCFKCHGPDDKARKAKLRLDVRADALKAITPGKPDDSELVRRILSDDESEQMPPPAVKNPLKPADKETLRRWIAEGAEYKPHWAFVAPQRPTLPNVKQSDWPRNPIDQFVLARLEKAGLQPSPAADRYTLVRRLFLDLIGLPPTPEEADAFVNDPRPQAFEELVDRLMASPFYGERWARRWLDLARYADTNGYEKDRPRSIWPYRDWIINALNRDLPFDQFSVEQLAGDLLPGATLEQRVATGFHRNTMLNEEGGIDPLEFRFHAMTDRVATTATTWLGLTLGCAQCHTHKFDPIPHREYFQFFAFLNNADEPEIAVPRPELVQRRRDLEKQIAAQTALLGEQLPRAQLDAKFNLWLKQEEGKATPWKIARPVTAKANLPFLQVLPDQSILASGDQSKRDLYEITFTPGPEPIGAIRLEVIPDERLPKGGPGRIDYEGPLGDFFLSDFSLFVEGKKVEFAQATHSFAAGGNTAKAATDADPQTGWSINGGQGKPHVAVFALATPITPRGEVTVKLLFERYYAAGLGRFRLATTPASATASTHPAAIEDVLALPKDKRSTAQQLQLRRHFLLTSPELAPARKPIDDLTKQLPNYPTTLVMQERPRENPRATFVHRRGEFLQPGEKVEPTTLSILHAFPAEAKKDRLAFARWLLAPDNPLVGRVTMNRQWAAFFGRGLVRTLEDFGYQGEPPSHPELLDWLAVEFVRQGWSLKAMHRLIVTSATYRQSSRVSPALLARDPHNQLLGRGPRLRLEAELIRDAVLRASGLLTARLGGPSVFPPQPPGVTSEGAYGRLDWKASEGPERYRRALYTYTKRTTPFAMLATFDGPSGEACVARREVSNTPLQALSLLNDVAMTEAAQELGRRTAAAPGTVEERLRGLFRRCLTRPPAGEEQALLVQFLQAQKERLKNKELDAAKLAGPGTGDVFDRAAWTAVARVLLNVDEMISRN